MQERLNKLLAQAGIASRRQAEELIQSGLVSVNGEIVKTLGTKADPEIDHIKVNGKLINKKLEKRENAYILLNKPKGYLSSVADPEGRKLVIDLVKGYGKLHPVGRLDYHTEGLIILTNDGEFTNVVASSKTVPKVYEVKVKGLPNQNAINKLRRGITLEDGFKTTPADIKELKPTENNGWFEVTLFEGHNQQIRKMFDAIGHSVVKLRRLAIGHIKDDRIPVGAYRELDAREIKQFLNPALKPLKTTESKKADEKPKLRPNSRYVAPKKLKRAKSAQSGNNPKQKKSLKDALRKKLSEPTDKPDTTLTRAETTQTRFKRPSAISETGLSKFKKASTRKPKR
ncbi:MAG: pseudouridine synthase [Pyrinomonadaceae bacterium]